MSIRRLIQVAVVTTIRADDAIPRDGRRSSQLSLAIVVFCVLMAAREAHCQLVELTAGGMARGTFLSRVVDGNTVDLFTGTSSWPSFTIRLARIDAPELDQPYGYEAGQHLSDLLGEEYVLSCSARAADIHGRWLATCGVINHVMVLEGAAWAYDPLPCQRPAHSPCSSALTPLQEAERQARAVRRGLWARPAPIPPSQWRATRDFDHHLRSEVPGVEGWATAED